MGKLESDGDVRKNGCAIGKLEPGGDIRKNGSSWGTASICCSDSVAARKVIAVLMFFSDFL